MNHSGTANHLWALVFTLADFHSCSKALLHLHFHIITTHLPHQPPTTKPLLSPCNVRPAGGARGSTLTAVTSISSYKCLCPVLTVAPRWACNVLADVCFVLIICLFCLCCFGQFPEKAWISCVTEIQVEHRISSMAHLTAGAAGGFSCSTDHEKFDKLNLIKLHCTGLKIGNKSSI